MSEAQSCAMRWCSRKQKQLVEYDGQWYCTQHAQVKARDAERDARWNAQREHDAKRTKLERDERDFIAGVANGYEVDAKHAAGELVARRQDLAKKARSNT